MQSEMHILRFYFVLKTSNHVFDQTIIVITTEMFLSYLYYHSLDYKMESFVTFFEWYSVTQSK